MKLAELLPLNVYPHTLRLSPFKSEVPQKETSKRSIPCKNGGTNHGGHPSTLKGNTHFNTKGAEIEDLNKTQSLPKTS